MTNSPSYPYQKFNLNNYRHISDLEQDNRFSENVELDIYSRGMGGIGLPGDASSMSRFEQLLEERILNQMIKIIHQ